MIVDGQLTKIFQFEDHFQTMAFVNAVAWVSHREDHHPEMVVGYDAVHRALQPPTRDRRSRPRTTSSAPPRSTTSSKTDASLSPRGGDGHRVVVIRSGLVRERLPDRRPCSVTVTVPGPGAACCRCRCR
jgi:hypothetical protein